MTRDNISIIPFLRIIHSVSSKSSVFAIFLRHSFAVFPQCAKIFLHNFGMCKYKKTAERAPQMHHFVAALGHFDNKYILVRSTSNHKVHNICTF